MFELKPIQDADKIQFKDKFIGRFSKLTDWELFKKFSLSYLRKSIRVNTLKMSVNDVINRLKGEWSLKQVPWCKDGFWIEHNNGRLDVGNTVEHVLGYYYVQESASMIPPVVLNPQPNEIVLDMCAAPGSKASQLAQMMQNSGVLVANDVTGDRLAALGINLQRMGVYNQIITQMPGQRFRKVGFLFDRVLVDAPCSGTGTIRKSLKTIQMWNPSMLKQLANVQRNLISAAFEVLKVGGTLVYSTCSLEPEENEAVVSSFCNVYKNALVEPINLPLKRSPAVLEFEGESYNSAVKNCLRLWPQDNDTEGFFVAKITKTDYKF
jgi:tRNA (cytosine49-C5)-methyltransferase